MDSIHDKHDKEVETLKGLYPDLEHLSFYLAAGCYVCRRGYLSIETTMTVNAKDSASSTYTEVIKALEEIETRARETRETMLWGLKS